MDTFLESQYTGANHSFFLRQSLLLLFPYVNKIIPFIEGIFCPFKSFT